MKGGWLKPGYTLAMTSSASGRLSPRCKIELNRNTELNHSGKTSLLSLDGSQVVAINEQIPDAQPSSLQITSLSRCRFLLKTSS
jgi:hypothetical protein